MIFILLLFILLFFNQLLFFLLPGVAERAISSMAGLQPQIEILERRISNDANTMNIEMKKNDERHQNLLDKLNVMGNSIVETAVKQEKTNTTASKLALDCEEFERKSSNTLLATEIRLRNEIIGDREDYNKKISSVQVRITSENERITHEINKKELDTTVNFRHQFEDLLERLENTKKSLFDELDRKCARILENSVEESENLKQKFKNQFSTLDSMVDRMRENQLLMPSTGEIFTFLLSISIIYCCALLHIIIVFYPPDYFFSCFSIVDFLIFRFLFLQSLKCDDVALTTIAVLYSSDRCYGSSHSCCIFFSFQVCPRH